MGQHVRGLVEGGGAVSLLPDTLFLTRSEWVHPVSEVEQGLRQLLLDAHTATQEYAMSSRQDHFDAAQVEVEDALDIAQSMIENDVRVTGHPLTPQLEATITCLLACLDFLNGDLDWRQVDEKYNALPF